MLYFDNKQILIIKESTLFNIRFQFYF